MTTSLSERFVTKLAGLGSRKHSRRTFLGAATLAGTAIAVNPWDYITKPQNAYASVCGPEADCGSGWSAMCCSINQGKNTCPPNTFAGGWWKADRSGFCGGAARYYIDCNALPGHKFTCRCNRSNCDQRYVACNVFRYGQCNTQIKGTTAVVCRQISCTPPWQLYPKACGHSSATDNNTRAHNAPCLSKANTHVITFPAGRNYLLGGTSLKGGQMLVSEDRHTRVEMWKNGNLVIHNQRGIIWQTNTDGVAAGGKAYMRWDGQLRVYDKNGVVRWRSPKTKAGGRGTLRIRNNGRLACYVGKTIIWQTNTSTP
ncbi:hypothetical protein [Jatrophihabitans fulvus]